MCEIRLAKLSCAAQQVGIVHFYAVTEIKGLSCSLWWMREWRNLLTPTHVGYRSVIRAVASGTSLKFGVQGASGTNWFSRVSGARDNGIRLYCTVTNADKLEPSQTARFMGPTWGPPGSCRPQMGLMLAQWTLLPGFLMFFLPIMLIYLHLSFKTNLKDGLKTDSTLPQSQGQGQLTHLKPE